jgi:hypothetical protein
MIEQLYHHYNLSEGESPLYPPFINHAFANIRRIRGDIDLMCLQKHGYLLIFSDSTMRTAQRRFYKTIQTLTRLRKTGINLQINIATEGGKQVNIKK